MSESANLLVTPNIELSDGARTDLASGLVHPPLVALLAYLADAHRIRINLIKTGHPLGPRTPGGKVNDHFFHKAADITHVDGFAVLDHPTSDGLVAVGQLLMAARPPLRPARVMGPWAWQRALGPGDRIGFRDDDFANRIHADHLHVGF